MIREALKSATRARHVEIEGSVPLTHPSFTLADYALYLQRQAAFLELIEPRLARFDDALAAIDPLARRKAHLARADLASLGHRQRATPPSGDDAARVPDPRTVPEALGVRYVLEGSMLGGQLIVRHLRAKWPDLTATRFLDAYGAHTGPRWKAFVAFLDAQDARELPAMTAFANGTFEALNAWLTPPAGGSLDRSP